MNDNVNKPAHYTKHKWEAIEILEEFFHSEPLLWQCGKYLLRCLYKNNLTEDLQKIIEKENNETRRKRKRS